MAWHSLCPAHDSVSQSGSAPGQEDCFINCAAQACSYTEHELHLVLLFADIFKKQNCMLSTFNSIKKAVLVTLDHL